MDWSREMKAAAITDAANLCELHDSASFLVARLRDYEEEHCCDKSAREWNGHVSPALARLEALLERIGKRDG